jgi:Uma2 family endonuclease
MAIKEQRMTLEEFLELPEEEPALEFEDGTVTQKVPPQGKHSALQLGLGGLLNSLLLPGHPGQTFSELRTTFGERSRVPDLAVYTWDRIPLDANGEVANEFREPPDIAIEIVSPGQSVNSLVQRCVTFIQAGTRAAIIVDPDPKTVVVFRAGRAPTVLEQSEDLDFQDIIPGLRLLVSQVFEALKH